MPDEPRKLIQPIESQEDHGELFPGQGPAVSAPSGSKPQIPIVAGDIPIHALVSQPGLDGPRLIFRESFAMLFVKQHILLRNLIALPYSRSSSKRVRPACTRPISVHAASLVPHKRTGTSFVIAHSKRDAREPCGRIPSDAGELLQKLSTGHVETSAQPQHVVWAEREV